MNTRPDQIIPHQPVLDTGLVCGFLTPTSTKHNIEFSIDDCITEMRPLVQDEKRQAIKYGEKYEYPVIFEKHKIRIKWEDSKIVQHTPPTPLKEAKPVRPFTLFH